MQKEKILKELYHGNLNPVAKTVIKGSDFYKLQCRLDDTVEKLTLLLNESEQELLEQAVDTWGNLNLISGEERFTEGFRLGAKIILEIFEKDGEQFKPITD